MILTCLTEVPRISWRTDTLELLATGLTGGFTMAGVAGVTEVRGHLTPSPRPPGTTKAEVGVFTVNVMLV